MLILFGSETGNAQDVAEEISREAVHRGLHPRVLSMDAYNVQELPNEGLVVLVAATTGQGDPPRNMRSFWRFLLRKSLPSDSLSGVKCSVFGLGDSGYVKYNVVAKKLANRLVGLGAEMIIEKGLGDDQHSSGYEAALDPWLESLWKTLEIRIGVRQSQGSKGIGCAKYCVRHLGKRKQHNLNDPEADGGLQAAVAAASAFRKVDGEVTGSSCEMVDAQPVGPWKPHMARVVRNERITSSDHFQDTRHIELDIQNSVLQYEPGDVLSIFPKTPLTSVNDFLEHFEFDGEDFVEISANVRSSKDSESSKSIHRIIDIVQGVMDISGASPRRFFFQVLYEFATETMEKDRLLYFASSEGRDDLYAYNQREGRSVLEVLKDFPSSKPPLEWLLQACPLKQPRQFSISSSLRVHPGQAHITAAIIKWRTPFRRIKMGLCTSWLAGITAGSDEVVPVWVEQGALKLPESLSVPMIMIGPGTGIAPFRSFLEERDALAKAHSDQLGASLLFFGCRNKANDFYYQQQLEDFKERGTLDKQHGLLVAFSRDQDRKVYVTHKLEEFGAVVREWIMDREAHIYVSGSAKRMPANVMEALLSVLTSEEFPLEAARKLLRSLELKGRYVVEAWS